MGYHFSYDDGIGGGHGGYGGDASSTHGLPFGHAATPLLPGCCGTGNYFGGGVVRLYSRGVLDFRSDVTKGTTARVSADGDGGSSSENSGASGGRCDARPACLPQPTAACLPLAAFGLLPAHTRAQAH